MARTKPKRQSYRPRPTRGRTRVDRDLALGVQGYHLKRSAPGSVFDSMGRVVRLKTHAAACAWIAERWDRRNGGAKKKREARRAKERAQQHAD